MKKSRGVLPLFFLMVSLSLSPAVKTRYGGEMHLRLNEPDSYWMSSSSHSNLLFYSLIYENLFYSIPGREGRSNLFKSVQFSADGMNLHLELHEGLAFSTGKAILSRHVKNSLTAYINRILYRSKRLAGKIKGIVLNGDYALSLQLTSPDPGIVSEMSAPELVLIADDEETFSGPYVPVVWEKGQKIELRANPYYAGGRQPIERVIVNFVDSERLDVFLAESGFSSPSYHSYSSGLYENTYITFPAAANTSQNKRLAFLSLCRTLVGLNGFGRLESLTSAEESPLEIAVKTFPDRKVVPILRNSKQIIYLASSLLGLQEALKERFGKLSIPLEIRNISDNELSGYIQKNPVPVLILKKLFRRETPLAEKLAALVREFSFNRFDEDSLGMIKQLEEISGLDREDVVIPALAGIMEKLVGNGLIMPMYQQRFQLMVHQDFHPVVLDYYSRILWSELRYERPKTLR